MKNKIRIISFLLMLYIVNWTTQQKAFAQVSANFQVFYEDLSPYGYWVDNSDYGYVWVPDVSSGFTPYSTNGYWIFTNAGWTWVSNYPWGWAPFHYGRWYFDPVYGYMWVPGNEWGPGWVTWRRSEGYYGWAPIGPGISLEIGYSSGYSVPHHQWTFVRNRDLGSTNINNYYINSSNNTTLINNSTVINNIQAGNSSHVKYNSGPERTEVEKFANKIITPFVIKENSSHSERLSKGELQIFRPSFEKNNDTGRKPVPAKVAGLKEVKQVGQRNSEMKSPKENQPDKNRPSPEKQSVEPSKQPIQQEPLNPPAEKKNPQHRQNIEPTHQPPLNQKSPQPQPPFPTQKKGGEIPRH